MNKTTRVLSLLLIAAWLNGPMAVHAGNMNFRDVRGKTIERSAAPMRVVSLVPSVTEMMVGIGAGSALVGITYHDATLTEGLDAALVGGFSAPDIRRIAALKPDLIFISTLHQDVETYFRDGPTTLVRLPQDTIAQSLDNLRFLGDLFGRRDRADRCITDIQAQLDLVARKVAKIPPAERKRVVRLMGTAPMTVPGDDAFQQEMIRAAGGLPPVLGRNGAVVEISPDQWRRFNPQVIYGCNTSYTTLLQQLDQPPWNAVDAVVQRRLFNFPCDLTCRAATHTGDFVAWLASRLYPDHFGRSDQQVYEDGVFQQHAITLDLDYVRRVRIDSSRIHDFVNKTLVVELADPMTVLSTLEGRREGIRVVGNHFSPAACWSVSHRLGLAAERRTIYTAIGHSRETSAFLFTGADMDRLSVQQARFKEMTAYALVTAGVQGNAVSMSRDIGHYYEPGTINILVLTNMKLSDRAMSRAVITATEAKTAALMDLDIRSSAGPEHWPATGTGTDNLIVIQGSGKAIDLTGGHSKMGELIARAVYDGVREAVRLQNGLTARRPIFLRLKERGITPRSLTGEGMCDCGPGRARMAAELEQVLMEDRYAGFVAAALAVCDDRQRGLITDIAAFEHWAHHMAEEIAGRPIETLRPLLPSSNRLPPVLHQALNALMNGIYFRLKAEVS